MYTSTLKNLIYQLVTHIKKEQEALQKLHGTYTPIAIKISPDLDSNSLREIAELLIQNGIDGIVATNTTISRPLNKKYPNSSQEGGLSGAPLHDMSQKTITELKNHSRDRLSIIGVGGIRDASTAHATLEAGADLIQLYTSLIYRGPRVIREIGRSLQKKVITS